MAFLNVHFSVFSQLKQAPISENLPSCCFTLLGIFLLFSNIDYIMFILDGMAWPAWFRFLRIFCNLLPVSRCKETCNILLVGSISTTHTLPTATAVTAGVINITVYPNHLPCHTAKALHKLR